MLDLINNETLTAGGIGIALCGLILKGVPAGIRWIIGNIEKDRESVERDREARFRTMQDWLEQLKADVKDARAEAKSAMEKVSECEARHDETFKAILEDKMKTEMSMNALKTRIDKISPT